MAESNEKQIRMAAATRRGLVRLEREAVELADRKAVLAQRAAARNAAKGLGWGPYEPIRRSA